MIVEYYSGNGGNRLPVFGQFLERLLEFRGGAIRVVQQFDSTKSPISFRYIEAAFGCKPLGRIYRHHRKVLKWIKAFFDNISGQRVYVLVEAKAFYRLIFILNRFESWIIKLQEQSSYRNFLNDFVLLGHG